MTFLLQDSATCLWRRLGGVGHDACRYARDGLGWLVEGCAVFFEGDKVATLSYRLRCDDRWGSRSASINGWIGNDALSLEIVRSADDWKINGRLAPELKGLVDIDLGFTPATNANAIRRLDLAEGEDGESTAVWLDIDDWQVKPLRQSYRRVDANHYDYESPAHDFRARLVTDDFGAVVEYPGLWRRE